MILSIIIYPTQNSHYLWIYNWQLKFSSKMFNKHLNFKNTTLSVWYPPEPCFPSNNQQVLTNNTHCGTQITLWPLFLIWSLSYWSFISISIKDKSVLSDTQVKTLRIILDSSTQQSHKQIWSAVISNLYI